MLLERINLEVDEYVIKIVRKHWWIIAMRCFFIAFLALFPLIAFLLIKSLTLPEAATGLTSLTEYAEGYSSELWTIYTAWLLLLWISLANAWTDHYLDLWAITNKRVILVDQRGFFHRFVSSFRLERLQDMNIEVNGVIPTLLDFGTIEAQTAGGSNEEFTSHNMPRPRDIKALILKAADERLPTKPDETAV